MAELRKPTLLPNSPLRQVIFVHGLNGNNLYTWSARKAPEVFWPDWLADDIPGTAIWSLGYPASPTRWQREGSAMALPDRAANVLPTLLSEMSGTVGDIIFVGYSLGGLVVQATLRRAEALAANDERTAKFLRRVRGLILLGTPNTGSPKAKIMSFLSSVSRPREPILDLELDNPYLRDLNTWVRNFVPSNGISALVIREHKPMRWLGLIVPASSADPGLPPSVQVIPVDEDHVSLSHPASRENEVYRHIADFLRAPLDGPHPDTLFSDALSGVQEAVRDMQVGMELTTEKLLVVQQNVEQKIGNAAADNPVVTNEALRRLTQLKQIRFAPVVDAIGITRRLLKAVEAGELVSASSAARQSIFAWCSRLLSSEDMETARSALSKAEQFGTSDETLMASALLRAHSPEQDKTAALSMLAPLRSPEGRAASLFIAVFDKTPEAGLSWVESSGLTVDEFHPDGKHCILKLQLEAGHEGASLETVASLTEHDFSVTPSLLFLAANAYLRQAIHPHLRNMLQLPLPTMPAAFPLGEDGPAMDFRSKAITSYRRAEAAFAALGAEIASGIASDRALWLELRDPSSRERALKSLQQSMADETVRLRRLPLASAFGLELDPQAVEREIERAMALGGGKSDVAAVARFTLAMESRGPEIADYISRHRDQLIQYYQPGYIDSIAIEALAKTGRGAEARLKLAEFAARDPDSEYLSQLARLVSNELNADTAAAREAEYLAEPTVPKLIGLVDELRRSNNTEKLAQFAGKLFGELRDTASAETYSSALYSLDADDKIVGFAEAHAEIVGSSEAIQTNVSWAYYRLGRLKEAKSILDVLRARRDDESDRSLFTNIALASGDWSSLGGFVESEWTNRNGRGPTELLCAGILAGQIGSTARSQELIRKAARGAKDDANILVNCYMAASSAGWEDEEVHGWLAKAFENSDEKGPIQKVDIHDLVEQQPIWNNRIDNTWKLLLRGEMPIFAAAKMTNRTLLDLFLRPALQNLEERDPRRRSLIFAFGGTKLTSLLKGKRLALDLTTLLTLTLTGQLRRVLEWSDGAVIAHTTLGWLFKERDKLAFHQPSLLRRAKEVKRLIDSGHIHQFEGSAPPPGIEKEVGDEIARYLVAAQSPDADDILQKIVVRPFPLPKAGTLLEENADVSGFEEHFAGCADVVVALRRGGHITDAEMANASSYIKLQEKPWPHNPVVEADATLYLDDVAVAYFQHMRLLSKLPQAGFKVFVSSSEVGRANDLLTYDASAEDARVVVEDLQTTLRDGLTSGKIILGRLTRSPHKSDVPNPILSMLADMPDVDALVVDDRFFNRHTAMEELAIVSSIDVFATMVKDGVLSPREFTQIKTKLRQAAAIFVPFDAGELEALLKDTLPDGEGHLAETAELRAIRQSTARIRMTDALQLPSDSVWVDSLTGGLIAALRAQWHDDSIPDETARARSAWICGLLDARGWAHVSAVSGIDISTRYHSQLFLMLLLPSAKGAARDRYWRWLQGYALDPIKDEAPELYRKLIESVQEAIGHQVDNVLAGVTSDDR